MMHLIDYFFLPGIAVLLLLALLSVYPLWRIVKRTGLTPYWSLLVLVPVLGFLAVGAVLAAKPWPAKAGEAA